MAKYATGAVPIVLQLTIESANIAKTAYVALDDRICTQKAYRLSELIGERSKLGFRLVEWDGKTATPIIDANGKIIGTLAGYPGPSDKWLNLQEQASRALEDAHHRTLRCGVSHGGGQTKPGNLCNSATNTQIVQELNSLEPFKRMAGFATSVMATWAPDMYAYYVECLGSLHTCYPMLKCNFTSSIFAASTYNLGPRTICRRHTNFANLAFGWCAVNALGSFNSKKGGHLVLWECGLVIKFPPGSMILLPLAIVSHCNVDIAPTKSHYSFMQYMAGGLFCWVENNFQTTADYRASLSPAALQDLNNCNDSRWSFGLSLLPQLETASTASL